MHTPPDKLRLELERLAAGKMNHRDSRSLTTAIATLAAAQLATLEAIETTTAHNSAPVSSRAVNETTPPPALPY